MPYMGADGSWHIVSTDAVTADSRQHLLDCLQCQTFHPNAYQEVKNMAGYDEESVMSNGREAKPRYIEDDLKVLKEIDDRIAELISQRHERFDMIRAQQEQNRVRVQNHEDWFEGNVRGNPVQERDTMPAPSIYPR